MVGIPQGTVKLFRSPSRAIRAHRKGLHATIDGGQTRSAQALSLEKQEVEGWGWLQRKAGLQALSSTQDTVGA